MFFAHCNHFVIIFKSSAQDQASTFKLYFTLSLLKWQRSIQRILTQLPQSIDCNCEGTGLGHGIHDRHDLEIPSYDEIRRRRNSAVATRATATFANVKSFRSASEQGPRFVSFGPRLARIRPSNINLFSLDVLKTPSELIRFCPRVILNRAVQIIKRLAWT